MFESRRWTLFFRLTPEGPLRSVCFRLSWKWFLPAAGLFLAAMITLGYFTVVGWQTDRQRLVQESREYRREIKRLNQDQVPLDELRRTSRSLKKRLENLSQQQRVLFKAAGISDPNLPFSPTKETSSPPVTSSKTRLEETVHDLDRWNTDLKHLENFARARVDVLRQTPMTHPTTGWLSSPFGDRVNPMGGSEKSFHSGLDIAATRGTPVHATGRGTVVYAGWNSGSGRAVKVRHGFGFTTAYNHLSRIEVEEGETVNRGDIVGRVGNTGWSTGNHLHYEVQIWKQPVDPLPYLVESFGPARVSLRGSGR